MDDSILMLLIGIGSIYLGYGPLSLKKSALAGFGFTVVFGFPSAGWRGCRFSLRAFFRCCGIRYTGSTTMNESEHRRPFQSQPLVAFGLDHTRRHLLFDWCLNQLGCPRRDPRRNRRLLGGFGPLLFQKHPTMGCGYAVMGFLVRLTGLGIVAFGLVLWFMHAVRR